MYFHKFNGAFKYDNIFPKILKWCNFVPKLFFVSYDTLQYEKFMSADFIHGNSFLKLQPKIFKRDNLGPKCKVFLFHIKLENLKNSKVLISIRFSWNECCGQIIYLVIVEPTQNHLKC